MVIITFTVEIIILLIVFISIISSFFVLTKNKIKQNEIKWLLFLNLKLSCITAAAAAVTVIWSKFNYCCSIGLRSIFCKFLLGNFFVVSLSRKKVFNLFTLNSFSNFFSVVFITFFQWARFCLFVNKVQIILLTIFITFIGWLLFTFLFAFICLFIFCF